MVKKGRRTCLCCGNAYSYCSHNCHGMKSEPWNTLFDVQNCRDVWHLLCDFEAGLISKEDAQKQMEKLDPSVITNEDAIKSYKKLISDDSKKSLLKEEAKVEEKLAEEKSVEEKSAVTETKEKEVKTDNSKQHSGKAQPKSKVINKNAK